MYAQLRDISKNNFKEFDVHNLVYARMGIRSESSFVVWRRGFFSMCVLVAQMCGSRLIEWSGMIVGGYGNVCGWMFVCVHACKCPCVLVCLRRVCAPMAILYLGYEAGLTFARSTSQTGCRSNYQIEDEVAHAIFIFHDQHFKRDQQWHLFCST